MRYFNTFMNHMERLTFEQVALLCVVSVSLGFLWLLGFSSRIKD